MDLNADGHRDFITGSFDGRPYVTFGSKDGYLTPTMMRDHTGKEMILGQYWDYDGKRWTGMDQPHAISVCSIDWDGDGDMDLIQGTSKGYVFMRLNQGSASEPSFASEYISLNAGKEQMKIDSGYAMPIITDWDQDGRWDLMSGSDSGAVYWYRNFGTPTEPRFKAAIEILAAAPKKGGEERSGTDSQIAVADLNGDGRLDLLVGDHSMSMDRSKDADKRNQHRAALRRKLKELEDQNASEEDIQAVLVELADIQPAYQAHGWVWLYLRAPMP